MFSWVRLPHLSYHFVSDLGGEIAATTLGGRICYRSSYVAGHPRGTGQDRRLRPHAVCRMSGDSPILISTQETYMPQTLTVSVYPDADSIANREPVSFHDVEYVSFVNSGTFGPPALVAPKPGAPGPPVARPGQEVVYINTSLIPLFKIERDGDDA